MWLEAIQWLTTAASLTGVLLNIHHRRACFVVWAFSNATWAGIDAWHGIWAQAALQAVYFVLSIYGLVKWKGKVANV